MDLPPSIVQRVAQEQARLPPGWLAQWGQKNGLIFYVETATGRTQWDPPVSAPSPRAPPSLLQSQAFFLQAPLASSRLSAPSPSPSNASANSASTARTEAKNPLAEKFGPPLSMRKTSSLSTAEKPSGLVSAAPPRTNSLGAVQAPPPTQVQTPPLPPGWIGQWSNNQQRLFYIYTPTGRTQWEVPGNPVYAGTPSMVSLSAPGPVTPPVTRPYPQQQQPQYQTVPPVYAGTPPIISAAPITRPYPQQAPQQPQYQLPPPPEYEGQPQFSPRPLPQTIPITTAFSPALSSSSLTRPPTSPRPQPATTSTPSRFGSLPHSASIQSTTSTATDASKKMSTKKMSTKGVKLSYFNFLVSYWTPARLAGCTTTQVCVELVKPWTIATGQSVVDLLSVSANPEESKAVDEADWFISHAWSYQFLDVVESINMFFAGLKLAGKMDREEDPIIWFDLFSNSQHDTGERAFEWWTTTFMEAIKKMRNVVMVCLPWDDPVTLTRAWCAFEVFATKRTHSSFHVAMTSAEDKRLIESFSQGGMQSWIDMLGKVSIARSESFKPTDRDAIFRVVQETLGTNGKGGIGRLDGMVKDVMNDWILGVVDEYARKAQTPVQSAALSTIKGFIHLNGGNVSKAIPLFEGVLNTYRAVHGDFHPSTVLTLYLLTTAYVESEDYRSAGDMFNQWIPKLEANPAASVAQVRQLKGICGNAFSYQCLYNDAERVLLSVYTPSIDCSSIAIYLGMTYIWSGRYQQALEVLYSNNQIVTQKYGPASPMSIITTLPLGVCYFMLKDYQTALPMLEECYQRTRAIFGELNPETLISMAAYGSVLVAADRAEEALPILEDSYSNCVEIYGSTHRRTFQTMLPLARSYKMLESHENAMPLLRTLVQNTRRLAPWQAYQAKLTLGQVCLYTGQFEQAIAPLTEACELTTSKPGFDDEDRRIAAGALADAKACLED
ncbi:hypothetical protein BC830DRAFT_1168006 [Chytriomyces sp. MP71]|nr:hypothetical protein BC830DRAFT_1168006 [Chytriomyces sp. MP71]